MCTLVRSVVVISKEMNTHTQMAQNAKLSVNLLGKTSDCGRRSPAACLFFPLQVFSSVAGTRPRGEGGSVGGGEQRACIWSAGRFSAGRQHSRRHQENLQPALTSKSCSLFPAVNVSEDMWRIQMFSRQQLDIKTDFDH